LMRMAPVIEEESSSTKIGNWVYAVRTRPCQARWASDSGSSGLKTST
jgi:hypothetical protein